MFSKSTKKKRKRTPMRRKVYLMERKTNRTWKSVFSGKREIKIGIAKNSKDRHQSVDNGIPGRVVVLAEYSINRASTVEAFLHKQYKKKNFTVRNAKKGAGATEFFRLSNRDLRRIKSFLSDKATNKPNLNLSFYLALVCLLAAGIILYHYNK